MKNTTKIIFTIATACFLGVGWLLGGVPITTLAIYSAVTMHLALLMLLFNIWLDK